MTKIVNSPEALAAFRQGLTGEHAIELIQQAQGKLLITLPVGVGKSQWIIQTAKCVAAGLSPYDGVLILVPRKDIQEEVHSGLLPQVDATIVRPRPHERCNALDVAWKDYERRQLGQLGREQLCGRCPASLDCTWPQQLSLVRGKPAVIAVHRYLANDPHFINRMRSHMGVRRLLTLIDESDILLAPQRRTIPATAIKQFIDIQRRLQAQGLHGNTVANWIRWLIALQSATEQDLSSGTWAAPQAPPAWVLATQRCGQTEMGSDYAYLGYDATALAQSDVVSRRRDAGGSISFAAPPLLGTDTIIYSGSITPRLARYRVDPTGELGSFHAPFADHRFSHAGTVWLNLRWKGGAACYFPGNSPQILDFFASKIAANITAGKRTLLVSRKAFVDLCVAGLTARLRGMGYTGAKIITGNWDLADFTSVTTLPLITYGVSGINRFESFDAAYCLNSFFISRDAIQQSLEDLDPAVADWDVDIRTDGAGNRQAVVPSDVAGVTCIPGLARDLHTQLEADRVVQAVGRVRPFTNAREVITFHSGVLPTVQVTKEFSSLAAIRDYCGIAARREAAARDLAAEAKRLRQEGEKQRDIARKLGIQPRSVGRYLSLP